MKNDGVSDKLTKLYGRVFGSPEGKMVLADILKFCHMMHSYYGRNMDNNTIMFNAGERNVGLYILQKMMKTPTEGFYMIAELEKIIRGENN